MNTTSLVPPATRSERNPLLWFLVWGLLGWSILVTAVVQGGTLFWAWSGLLSKIEPGIPRILSFGVIAPLAVLLPGSLLLFVRDRRQAAVIRVILMASFAALLLLLPRLLFSPISTYAAALFRAGLSVGMGTGLLLWLNHRGRIQRRPGPSLGLMLSIGLVLLLPWLKLGALGDGFDTFIALLQASGLALLAVGLAAYLMPHLAATAKTPTGNVWLGGITLATALFAIAGAWGQMDTQALLAGVLPALGFPLAFIQGRSSRYDIGSGFVLAVVVVFGPFAFADPRETNLLTLLDGDVARWTLWATTIDFLLGWLLALVLGALADRLLHPPLPTIWLTAGVVGAVAAAGFYFLAGQPGFYGDDFFVVLTSQADVTPAYNIADVDERRAWVYRTLVDQADQTQVDLLQWLDSRDIDYTRYYLVNGIEVHASALRRWQISRRDDVDRILYSPTLRPLPEPISSPPGINKKGDLNPWGIEKIEAPRVWSEFGVTGEGIVIGQSDSGVDVHHPALADSYRGRDMGDTYNWFDPWRHQPSPYDNSGHGTHTLGTALGQGGIGVAPGATWFACANLVRNLGNPAYYLDCMQFMLAPHPGDGDPLHEGRPELAADISTNSWGCPPLLEGCDQLTLWQATAALRAAGIFFVAAAGNDGPACDSLQTPPGNYGDVLSVGAIDAQGNLTSFSSRGPNTLSPDGSHNPTLLAPGEKILSAWPGGGWFVAQGTSMAAPHVAGVVALMWSANPALRGDIDTTRRILIETATPYTGVDDGCGTPDEYPDSGAGYGIVNAYAAVRQALALR
ncbi:MAG: S8 family serine peptidase [Chloroflexi bacterium]|nr:S8 family serine peptidase [Chloroflexota bacterium]